MILIWNADNTILIFSPVQTISLYCIFKAGFFYLLQLDNV
jgi:hypothetical protein